MDQAPAVEVADVVVEVEVEMPRAAVDGQARPANRQVVGVRTHHPEASDCWDGAGFPSHPSQPARDYWPMRRRTFRQIRAKTESQFHHHVYVVLLDPAVMKDRKVRAANPKRDPARPCLYVGMTGLLPEERFWNHKNGEKAARVVTRFGVRLLPEMFAHLNPMPFEAAAQMEKELAEDLRAQGYTVLGGT